MARYCSTASRLLFPTVQAKYPRANKFVGTCKLILSRSHLLVCPFNLLAQPAIVSLGLRLASTSKSVVSLVHFKMWIPKLRAILSSNGSFSFARDKQGRLQ